MNTQQTHPKTQGGQVSAAGRRQRQHDGAFGARQTVPDGENQVRATGSNLSPVKRSWSRCVMDSSHPCISIAHFVVFRASGGADIAIEHCRKAAALGRSVSLSVSKCGKRKTHNLDQTLTFKKGWSWISTCIFHAHKRFDFTLCGVRNDNSIQLGSSRPINPSTSLLLFVCFRFFSNSGEAMYLLGMLHQENGQLQQVCIWMCVLNGCVILLYLYQAQPQPKQAI